MVVLPVHLVGSTINCTRLLRTQMVEDGLLQVRAGRRRMEVGQMGHREVLLPASNSEAPVLGAHSAIRITMRSYAKNYKSHPSTVERPSRVDYKNRTSFEWDIRLDIVNGFTSAKALEHAVAHKAKIQYCLIGAEEAPDNIKAIHETGTFNPQKPGSEEIHIHVALVLKEAATRADVLQLLRGPRSIGLGNEYAVPRNPKFTYAGWLAHHTKVFTKINANGPYKLLEFGDLPMDAYDEATCWKVIRMIKKFGNEEMTKRFKGYSDKADEYKLAKAIRTLDEVPPVEDTLKQDIQEKLGGEVIFVAANVPRRD